MNLSLAASPGLVHLITEDGDKFAMTPELAEELAVELPKKATQARILAASEPPIAEMYDTLRALGYKWMVKDFKIKTGWWEMNRVRATLVGDYQQVTRSLYYDVVMPREGVTKH